MLASRTLRTALGAVSLSLLLGACGEASAGVTPLTQPRPAGTATGMAALGAPARTVADAVAFVQARTGGCKDPKNRDLRPIDIYEEQDWAAALDPFFLGHARCYVNGDTVDVLVFQPDGMVGFQKAYAARVKATGAPFDRPDPVAYGPGFIIDAHPTTLAALGALYLRCVPGDTLAARAPSEVDGCAYSTTPGF
ncbi:hypothetical protein R8Z50_01910 [Longispora sp. K20-0274]|uniref:hypothetical protein n=1 Tax=Longispora sp. K20-0274 TaxID=3088255 RepID=UPI00399A0A45